MGFGCSRGNFAPGTGWECLAVDGGGSVQAAELMTDPQSSG